jgi:predicted enzyme related to lactoylglutathione lyase
MTIHNAGPTIVTSKGREAVAFHAKHFGAEVNDYGAGDECWYWTVTFGGNSELSFMMPQGGEPEFDGKGLFFYLDIDTHADVDALCKRIVASGLTPLTESGAAITKPYLDGGMYQFWLVDPAGVRLMLHSTTE